MSEETKTFIKYRVGIPTTSGVSWIVGLDVIDPLPVNQVLKQDGFQQLRISSDYHQLCQNALLQLGYQGPFRLTLSDDVETGRSWELPVLLAHILHGQNALAFTEEESDESLLATGAVSSDFKIIPERYHLEAKIGVALEERVKTFFMLKPDAEEVKAQSGLDLAFVESLKDIEAALELDGKDVAADAPASSGGLIRRATSIVRSRVAAGSLALLVILCALWFGAQWLSGNGSIQPEDHLVWSTVTASSAAGCFEWSQTGQAPIGTEEQICGLELAGLNQVSPVILRLSPQSSASVHQSSLSSLLEGVLLPTQPDVVRVPFRKTAREISFAFVEADNQSLIFELNLGAQD